MNDISFSNNNPSKPNLPPKGNTKAIKRPYLYAVLIPLAFLVGLAVGYLFWGRQVGGGQENTVKRYNVSTDDDPVIGAENAEITIIEFSDYECPYCRRWFTEVFGRILEEYPDQVRIVFRDFPLNSIHPNAAPAAEAANCAGEQDFYWEFHNKLFSGGVLGEEIYYQYANELDLDMEKFKSCLESTKYEGEIIEDYQYAAALGVRSAPTFFLNGIPIVGAQPYEVFKEVIDKELAGEIP